MRIEVFISYAHEDGETAELVVSRLEKEGLIVWWDRRIRRDEPSSIDQKIEQAIDGAGCVVVLWSRYSVRSNWVRGEATTAEKAEQCKVIHLSLERNLNLPVRFQDRQCTDLDPKNPADLDALAEAIKAVLGIQGPNEHVIQPRVFGEMPLLTDLAIDEPIPGAGALLSFRPCGDGGVFLLMRYETSDSWVDRQVPNAEDRHKKFASPKYQYTRQDERTSLKVGNEVFIINDPLRPFTIQIGSLRSQRPSAKPGIIAGDISTEQLRMLPLQIDWLCMTLAEILSTPETLRFLSDQVAENTSISEERKKSIQTVIAKNPNSPQHIQKQRCVFCDPELRKYERLSALDQEERFGAYLIANGYPFGPHFHYLAITTDPVHSWEDLTLQQLCGLNLLIHEFCHSDKHPKYVAGVELGFNSSIRHLVLGKKTHTSAGASVPHIHKQVWGMVSRTCNLAEQLICVSQAYWSDGIDYLACYQKALKQHGYVIWQDDHVMLYVPYGQCSMHELQAMTVQPCGSFTELTVEQVISLSKAEYIALRIFKALGVGSFNQVLLTKLHNDTRAPKFRLVEAFITRDVDLAVSELSMLYVVDRHPWASLQEVVKAWESLTTEVTMELEEGSAPFLGTLQSEQ